MSTPKLRTDLNFWVTSDTHYGHRFVAEDVRKFPTKEDHDEHLIASHNRVVDKDDVVIHLGDVTFLNATKTLEVFKRLNGHYIFVAGNHDSSRILRRIVEAKLEQGKSVSEVWPRLHETKLDDVYLTFCHYPLAAWNQSDRATVTSINLHGHLHGSKSHHHAAPYLGDGIRKDIGVDNSPSFGPFNLNGLIKDLRKEKK